MGTLSMCLRLSNHTLTFQIRSTGFILGNLGLLGYFGFSRRNLGRFQRFLNHCISTTNNRGLQGVQRGHWRNFFMLSVWCSTGTTNTIHFHYNAQEYHILVGSKTHTKEMSSSGTCGAMTGYISTEFTVNFVCHRDGFL
jgi:hypothetical protein